MKKTLILCAISMAYIVTAPAQPMSSQDIYGEERQDLSIPVHLAQVASYGAEASSGGGGFEVVGGLGASFAGGMGAPCSAGGPMPEDVQPPQDPVARNYPALADIIIPELHLDETYHFEDFIGVIQELFPVNWMISPNTHIRESTMPNMHFTKISIADVLDALNDFSSLSPEYNLIFKSKSNIISVHLDQSQLASSNQRNIYTFPMAELNQKFEMETILSLLQATLEMDPTAEFKNSPFEPKYHTDTQTLMLKLLQNEFPVVKNTFNTLIANAQSMDLKRSILVDKYNQLHSQASRLEAQLDKLNKDKMLKKHRSLESKNQWQTMQREFKNLEPTPQQRSEEIQIKLVIEDMESEVRSLESDIFQLKLMLDKIKAEMLTIEFKR